MAFGSDLTISPDTLSPVATNNLVYTITGYPQGSKSIRIDTLSTSTEPVTLEISHREEGSGVNARAVRTMTWRKKKLNAESQLVETSVTTTLRCPKDTAIVAADTKRGFNVIANLLYASGAFDKMFRGEI